MLFTLHSPHSSSAPRATITKSISSVSRPDDGTPLTAPRASSVLVPTGGGCGSSSCTESKMRATISSASISRSKSLAPVLPSSSSSSSSSSSGMAAASSGGSSQSVPKPSVNPKREVRVHNFTNGKSICTDSNILMRRHWSSWKR